MNSSVENHYAGSNNLTAQIKDSLSAAGKAAERPATADLAAVDEFHIRGRQATLELAQRMELTQDSHVLDIGSGLGGPARTLAETYGCSVTGLDLTRSFCNAAAEISNWVGLTEKVRFVHGDATAPPFDPGNFDAAMTIHVAMNIPAKDAVYASARRALKPGRIFAVYDVLQGEGGQLVYPVPWARNPSISHLATPAMMRQLLAKAGFDLLEENDSTEESLAWFRNMTTRMAETGPPPVSFQLFLGADFPQMARNQVQNLTEKRIRTVAYICRA